MEISFFKAFFKDFFIFFHKNYFSTGNDLKIFPIYGNLMLPAKKEQGGFCDLEKKIKVLLADNSESFGLTCAARMRTHGLEVETTEKDGKALVESIVHKKPDVVIMDFFLPRMDAIGVMSSIHAMKLPQTPQFMVMSAFDNSKLEREAIQAGADYYFLKPFDADEMACRILALSSFEDNIEPFRQNTNTNSLEIRVTEILHQIGVPAHIKGYQYLRDSILMAIDDDDIINAVTKRLYPAVAKKHGTTSSRVERAIRHAIEVAWDRGDIDVLNSYFGYTIHNDRGKPTNSEFVAMISDKFRLQLKIS